MATACLSTKPRSSLLCVTEEGVFFFSFPIPIKVIETLDHDYKYILFFMSADTGMYTDRKYKTKYIRCHFSVNLTCRRDTCAEEFHM